MALDLFTWADSRPKDLRPSRGPARLYLFPIHTNARLVERLAAGVVERGGVRAARWLGSETRKLGAALKAASIPDREADWAITRLCAAVGYKLSEWNESGVPDQGGPRRA